MADLHPCALESPLHDYLRDDTIPGDIRQDRAAMAWAAAPEPDCSDPEATAWTTQDPPPMTQAGRDAQMWRQRMIEDWTP